VASTIDRLIDLWRAVPTGDDRDQAAFAAVYTDPVVLNGEPVAVSDLVGRYRTLHASFADLAIDLVAEMPAADDVGAAVVLRQRGRHVGPLTSPLGTVEPSDRTFDVLGIDVLALDGEGRVASIWVVADELGRLAHLGAFDPPVDA
jgi:hypothetical protein